MSQICLNETMADVKAELWGLAVRNALGSSMVVTLDAGGAFKTSVHACAIIIVY